MLCQPKSPELPSAEATWLRARRAAGLPERTGLPLRSRWRNGSRFSACWLSEQRRNGQHHVVVQLEGVLEGAVEEPHADGGVDPAAQDALAVGHRRHREHGVGMPGAAARAAGAGARVVGIAGRPESALTQDRQLARKLVRLCRPARKLLSGGCFPPRSFLWRDGRQCATVRPPDQGATPPPTPRNCARPSHTRTPRAATPPSTALTCPPTPRS